MRGAYIHITHQVISSHILHSPASLLQSFPQKCGPSLPLSSHMYIYISKFITRKRVLYISIPGVKELKDYKLYNRSVSLSHFDLPIQCPKSINGPRDYSDFDDWETGLLEIVTDFIETMKAVQ